MTNLDIKKIETELSIVLPKEYKDLMSDYPFKDINLPNVEDDLWNDVGIIIETNKKLRKNGFFEQEWNKKWYAFGHDGFDNYYYLNASGNNRTVYLAWHEGSIQELEANSFSEWISKKKELYKEYVADQMKKDFQSKNKKWWQFWIK